jgi:hypothetical protein
MLPFCRFRQYNESVSVWLTKACPVTTVDIVQVVAVLRQKLGVCGVECKPVATGL